MQTPLYCLPLFCYTSRTMETEKKPNGALFGSIVIIIILIIGGIYIFYAKLQEMKNTPNVDQNVGTLNQTP